MGRWAQRARRWSSGYVGEPNNPGIDIYDRETLTEFAMKAFANGLSVSRTPLATAPTTNFGCV